jgi:hypothetical protein
MIFDWGTTTAAIVTIVCISFMFKDNLGFRFLQDTMIGLSNGLLVATALNVQLTKTWPGLTSFQLWAWLGLILGLLVFGRFTKAFVFLSRWTSAILLGVATGVGLGGFAQSQIVQQIIASAQLKFTGVDPDLGGPLAISSIILLVTCLTTLAYFIFTWSAKGAAASRTMNYVWMIGRYSLMIAFGASYGNTVTGRFSSLLGRVSFIVRDWLYPMLGLS